MIKYQAKIYKDGKSYSVEFPDLPGCFSMGDTLEEAKTMAKDALSLYWSFDKPTPAMQKVYPRILFGKAVEYVNDGQLIRADELLTKVLADP